MLTVRWVVRAGLLPATTGGRMRYRRVVRVAAATATVGFTLALVTSPPPASASPVFSYSAAAGCCGDQPWDITAGPDGNLWYTTSGGVVYRMDTSGYYTGFWPVGTSPTGIVAGPDGNLWVSEWNAIEKVTTSGTRTAYADNNTGASRITVGPDGNLWFTSSDDTIGQMTTAGSLTSYSSGAVVPPLGITTGSDGKLWFLGTSSNTLSSMTTAGWIFDYPGGAAGGPQDITAGPDGALWYTDTGQNLIVRVTTAGFFSFYSGVGIDKPGDITTGPDGALWFTNPGNNSIGRITTSGVVSNFSDPGIRGPQGITTGPDGALWFTNRLHDTIGRLDIGLYIATPSLPTALRGVAYSAAFQTHEGTAPFKWSVTSGTLPKGLHLTSAGTVVGTPKADGTSAVTVQVVDNTKATATRTLSVTVGQPAPIVTKIVRDSGPGAGGNTVSVHGSALWAASEVSFGGDPGTVESINPAGTKLTAVVPAGLAGTADVQVVTPGGTSLINAPADDYTFLGPTITKVSPKSGGGSTAVTITGSNLQGATDVTFDGVSVSFSVTPGSGRQITATAPLELPPGPVDIIVTTPGGPSPIGASDVFTFT